LKAKITDVKKTQNVLRLFAPRSRNNIGIAEDGGVQAKVEEEPGADISASASPEGKKGRTQTAIELSGPRMIREAWGIGRAPFSPDIVPRERSGSVGDMASDFFRKSRDQPVDNDSTSETDEKTPLVTTLSERMCGETRQGSGFIEINGDHVETLEEFSSSKAGGNLYEPLGTEMSCPIHASEISDPVSSWADFTGIKFCNEATPSTSSPTRPTRPFTARLSPSSSLPKLARSMSVGGKPSLKQGQRDSSQV
jgi:hypothetical protein